MSTNPSAGTAEEWMRSDASDNANSITNTIFEESIGPIGARMDIEIPNASAKERKAWLIAFLEKYPSHSRPHHYRNGIDPRTLTPTGKLDLIHGEDPRKLARRKRLKK